MDRIDDIEKRVTRLEGAIANNTVISTQTRDNTTELLEWFRDYKSSLRVLARVGSFIKWTVAVGAGLAAAWGTYRGLK